MSCFIVARETAVLEDVGKLFILNLKYACIAKIFNSLNKENVDKKLNYI